TGRAAPTGIERVEFQYAKWLSALSDVDVRFVATLAKTIRLVPEASVHAFLKRQGQTWSEGAEGFDAGIALANINSFLAGDEAPRAPRLSHLSEEERRQRQRPGKANRRAHPITSWAQQMAATWAHDPIGPVLRRASSRQPIIYLRASADRLENPAPFEQLKEAGVKLVVMTYDTIPLDFPEFVRPKAAALCADRVKTMARLADGIVAISHYSATRLKPLLQPYRPPITTAHLGVDLPAASVPLSALCDTPFFLVTSTIEARKNHHLLLNVWRRMVDEMGEKTPKLILAGKRGWEAQAALAMLDRAAELRPHVYEAGAVPDEVLDLLRRRARAVLMPSFVEGFGLPVTEALSVDTPVIASDIPVFREIAGEACEFIDPLDGVGWRNAICDFAAVRSPRWSAAVSKARAYEPPTWASHFAKVSTLLDDLASHTPVSAVSRVRRAIGAARLSTPGRNRIAIQRPTDGRPV
ncbi:MAG: glycosyltransferase family 1 protein, partial [Pseudomonadota bacterium]